MEAGWKVSNISATLKISRPTIYHWKKRFLEQGIAGLYDISPARVHFDQLVSIEDIISIFQFIENNPKIGHYRVKMLLNGRGHIIGHTKIWEIISLYREAKQKEEQISKYEKVIDFPFVSHRPHHNWFCDVRYLVQYGGRWVYSILILDGYTRKILSGGAFLHQDFVHFLVVLKDALILNGCPENIVSDNGGIFKTSILLTACEGLGINHSYIEKGKPWQNLMETTFSIERRMLDSYVVGCDDLKQIYASHQRFIKEFNNCGHWHHKSKTEDGRVYYRTPQAVMGYAKGNAVTEEQIHSLFALEHCVRVVDNHGQIKLHNYIFYVDEGLRREKVDISIYPDCLRVEFDGQVIVEYPCYYDSQKKRVTKIDSSAVWWAVSSSKQTMFFSQELYRVVFAAAVRSRLNYRNDNITQGFLNFTPVTRFHSPNM